MIEAISEAIVLDKEDLGEYDSRVFLYTKDLGKISAKATSLRKITSKLAAHLEPLNYLNIRLVSRGDFFDAYGFQVADALYMNSASLIKSDPEKLKQTFRILDLLKQGIPENVPDLEIWNLLSNLITGREDYSFRSVLGFLGFSPEHSICLGCSKGSPEYFFPKDGIFFCRFCALNQQIANLLYVA